MNAVALLKADHTKVKSLLKELDDTTERAVKTRPELLAQIRKEMIVHEAIEEEIFYPALQDLKKASDLVNESYEEHHVVDVLLDELAALDPSDEVFTAKATVLRESIQHHIGEEEEHLFPRAERLLGKRELEELGSEMEDKKLETLEKMIGVNS